MTIACQIDSEDFIYFFDFLENMNFIAIYDFNHVSFTFSGLDMVSAVISLIVIVMILINLGGMMYW